MIVNLHTSDLKTFKGINNKYQSITLGNGNAVSPMEAVLLAAAGCSTIDIAMILEKMRQPVKSIDVQVEGQRRDEIPKIFTKIHMHYTLTGNIKEKKVVEAIDLSLNKYCSVSIMLSESVEISSSFNILTEA